MEVFPHIFGGGSGRGDVASSCFVHAVVGACRVYEMQSTESHFMGVHAALCDSSMWY